MELLGPRNDFLFKRIFGSEENRDVLLAFLNRTFSEANRPTLGEIVLLNPYTDQDSPSDKQSILDILARTVEGELINVEMQLFNRYDTEKRTLYYWSKQYGVSWSKGNPTLRSSAASRSISSTFLSCLTICTIAYFIFARTEPKFR